MHNPPCQPIYPAPCRSRWWCWLALLLVGFASWVYSASPAYAEDQRIRIRPTAILSAEPEVGLEQITSEAYSDQWRDPEKVGSSFMARSPAAWLRFEIDPDRFESLADQWLLVVHMSTMEEVQVHTYNSVTNDWWSSRPLGMIHPIEEQYVRGRYWAFPLPLTEGQPLQVYMRAVSNSAVALPISLSTREHFIERSHIELIILGGLLGSLLVMLLYNLSLYSILWDKSYLYYSLYVLTVFVYQVVLMGLGHTYFGIESYWFNAESLLFFASLSFLVASLFVYEFLDLKHYNNWLPKSFYSLATLWSVLSITALFTLSPLFLLVINISSLITLAMGLFTAYYLIRRGVIIAQIFSFAWLAAIVGSLIFILMINGVLPLNTVTAYSQQLGFFVEMVLLSFALAYRINQEKLSREQAQAESLTMAESANEERLQRIQAQQETLALQRQLNEQLERQVEERTRELQITSEQLEQANRQLTQLAVTDQLTQIANRRQFDDQLNEEYRRAQRNEKPMAVILMDIDHFKPVNDEYGHSVGDEALIMVAKTLAQFVHRPGDLVARYGGEEFAFILPGCSLEDAFQLAEQVRRAVAGLAFSTNNTSIPLTISAGVAAWVPKLEDGARQLVDAADRALYEAKASGRNKVKAGDNRPRLIKGKGQS